MDTAKELVEKAHAKGLYVFFDGVFGHHKDNVVPSPSGLTPSGSSNPVSYLRAWLSIRKSQPTG
ncbi:neopullulanase [Vibrio ishigakensis]|uniref:Neopullulanase n=1 Tax=Vibrio ishigakensis TaxID=1481914 RepID=A0A0B8PPS3_9VIBR|nr:neopullulanase [Vibrio ishigakensis]GAM69735.1 neopullulanase [Vibrio sp. JCM 19236]